MKPRRRKPRRRTNVYRRGPIRIWNYDDLTGWRANCTLCDWTDGDKSGGDYAWNVEERAQAHIEAQHERRNARVGRRKDDRRGTE